MSRVLSYRDLDAWQKAMTLVERCYKLTASFPRDELFGLTAQVRRAAVSIPANIAKGTDGRGLHTSTTWPSLSVLRRNWKRS